MALIRPFSCRVSAVESVSVEVVVSSSLVLVVSGSPMTMPEVVVDGAVVGGVVVVSRLATVTGVAAGGRAAP